MHNLDSYQNTLQIIEKEKRNFNIKYTKTVLTVEKAFDTVWHEETHTNRTQHTNKNSQS